MIRTIAGIDLEIEERGSGRPLLVLHGGDGLAPERPWLNLLARTHRVIAPLLPGFGRSSLPDWIGTVDDIAYLYLDTMKELDLDDVTILGTSFGGWVAAEMLVRSTARVSRAVLSAPLGIKVGGVNDRDIADMHAMTREEYLAHAWANPAGGTIDMTSLSETEIAQIVRGREAVTLFGWKPYMHNPRLRRWLHRIDVPTLILWGDRDRIISKQYVEGWQKSIAGSRLEIIADCGHFPLWEQPERSVRLIDAFTG